MAWQHPEKVDIPTQITDWCEKENLHPSVVPMLYKRGYNTVNKLNHFFNGTIADVHKSTEFGKPMVIAVHRLVEAIKKGQHIVIFGDYDVDGTTSISVIITVFEYLKEKMGEYFTYDYIVPDRFSEGYGLNPKNVGRVIDKKPDLVITVDCGVGSVDEISILKQHGIDVIVTDHHKPGDILPKDALAIIHPMVTEYPFESICGCAVAYHFMNALWEVRGKKAPEFVKYGLLDYVAIATIADMVPLVGDNRIYVREGFKLLNANECRLPFQVMKKKIRLARVDSMTVGFDIGPRINAAGRIESAALSVDFLTSTDEKECAVLYKELNKRNERRKEIGDSMEANIMHTLDVSEYKHLIVTKGKYHGGVVGIVASTLMQRFNRPTFVLYDCGDYYGCSGRSIEGIDIVEMIKQHKDLLITFGGHAMAMGLKVKKENVDTLFRAIDEELSKLPKSTWLRVLKYDGAITEDNLLSSQLFNTLRRMEPFGQKFENPVWRVIAHVEYKTENRKAKTYDLYNKFLIGNYEKMESFPCTVWNSSDIELEDSKDYLEQVLYGRWGWNNFAKNNAFTVEGIGSFKPSRISIPG